MPQFVGVTKVIAEGDYRKLICMDLAFHQAVGEASHNRWLARVTNTLIVGALRFWRHSLRRRSEETLRTEIEAHLRVAKAIQQGDPDAAQLAMRDIEAAFPATVKDVFDESMNPMPIGHSAVRK